MDDLFATHDALAVAELVKTRKLGARELLDGTLHRLARSSTIAERRHRFL